MVTDRIWDTVCESDHESVGDREVVDECTGDGLDVHECPSVKVADPDRAGGVTEGLMLRGFAE